MAKKIKGYWIVTIRATVRKAIYTSECTEEEARKNPYANFEDERELEQSDYEVIKVEPSE